MRCALAAAASLVAGFGAPAAGEPVPDPSRLQGPGDIAADPLGNLWVVDTLGIMRVTRDGHFSRAVDTSEATAITRGPDGAMWFTEYRKGHIGRIAPDGHIDYFSDGLTSGPADIARGPDGNLWFTEPAGRIGRITPAGNVTEFSQGLRAKSEPNRITAGPDGCVWFTDYHAAIGRITPAGRIDEFPVPPKDYVGPEGIAAGPGNSLWFAYANRLGRIRTTGRVRFFRTPFSSISSIAGGPDGAIWVAGYREGLRVPAAVGRITPRGRLRLFERGLSGRDTRAITRAPDGSIWVTEGGRSVNINGRAADAVARVSAHHSAVELPPTPACVVPRLVRLPLLVVEDRLYESLCRIDLPGRRAGRRRKTVALHAFPPAGSVLPFDTRVQVRFGPVPPLPKTCRVPFGGRRLAVSRILLVFAYSDYDGETGESTTHYSACLRSRGRLRAITNSEDLLDYYEEASGFRVAGSFVAYTFYTADHYGNEATSLNVYDVRRAHAVFGEGVDSHDAGYPSDTELGEYVVSDRGSVAWLIHAGDTFHLYAHGRLARRTRELDSGPSLTGLHFSADTLSWTSGSESRSAEVR